jgi:tRNA modification GTPase
MQIEACLDFPEEDIDFIEQLQVKAQLQAMIQQNQALLMQAEQGRLLRDGLKMVIAGQPNAGKSSLLNALAGAEVAIVTAIPGTTRDVLTQTLHIEGVPLHVLDTAGLRDAAMADEVEQIGMQRAWAQIADADIVLLLKDLSLEADEEYVRKQTALDKKIQTHTGAQTRVIRVSNKADLAPASVATHANGVNISAKTGWGMQELRAEILKQAGGNASLMEGVFTARTRHIEALKNVETHLTLAPGLLAQNPPPLDIVAEECRLAQQALSQITGELTADDLLGEIFSRFCIGK